MKKYALVLLTTTLGFDTQAQPAGGNFWDDPIGHPMMPVYVVGAFLIIITVLVVVVAYYLFRVLNMMTQQMEREKALLAGVPYTKPKGFWARWWEKINATVPVEKEKEIELDHEYDGIRELDNHLPPWWKWLFYGTIAWAFVYLLVFHVYHWLPLSQAEYDNEMARAEEQKRIVAASQPVAAIEVESLEFTGDAAMIEGGKAVFVNNNCGSCHRNDGGGNMIGPNLTDDYWLHGGSVKDIFVTIRDGVVDKGMPAWGRSLKPTEVRDVTFFVMSLRGSNPPDAKSPQGERYQGDEGNGAKGASH